MELGSRAGALKQMLLDILEDTHEIRHICIIGRNCVLKKENDEIECSVPLDKEIAEGVFIILPYPLLLAYGIQQIPDKLCF